MGPLPRGSVRLPDGSVIPGYPSIGRIQTLRVGLAAQFSGAFHAEEKMDGYNVRVVRHEGEILAFSRGGFACPFATDRAPEFLGHGLFEEDPGAVVCAEFAGPENPYIEGHPPEVTEDVALFAFDLMGRGHRGFRDTEAKRACLERHGIRAAAHFGRFRADQLKELCDLVLELDARGAEGVVFKADAAEGGRRAKYVTARSNVQDIECTSSALLDLPPEYFTNRFLRMALFMEEHGRRGDPDLERRLGRAVLEGIQQASASIGENGVVDQPFRCRFRQRENAERFVRFLKSTGGKLTRFPRGETPYREGAFWVLEFSRQRERMTSWLRDTLWGGVQFD